MEDESYKIKTNQFEGPLELLLSLIESRKLFINDISLAEVTNEYIEYIRSITNKDIGKITSFISIASTLVLIKARSLLPNLELTKEESEDVSNLEERLNLYKKISESVLLLQSYLKTSPGKLLPLQERKISQVFAPTPDINIESISSAIQSALSNLPEEEEKLHEVTVKITVGIETMIERITERVQNAFNTSFQDFCKAQTEGKDPEEVKVVTIVSFLALLELIREGLIDALQDTNFSDMTIKKMEAENMIE